MKFRTVIVLLAAVAFCIALGAITLIGAVGSIVYRPDQILPYKIPDSPFPKPAMLD